MTEEKLSETQKAEKQSTKARGYSMKWIKRLCSFIFLCVVIAGGVLLYEGYQDYREALDTMSVEEMAERIEANDNYTEMSELPQTYIDAVLAVEDKRFYSHPGIDPIAIGRALFNDIRAGTYVAGGSTITQQLAKNLYFTQERSFIRKAAEMFMAFRLEQTYTKDEILELYVNSIYFGDGYYCVRDASEGYFGKEPGEMTDYESTLLAGIPNAPSVYSLTANPDLAEQRQQYVLRQMEKYGYLDAQEANAILQNG